MSGKVSERFSVTMPRDWYSQDNLAALRTLLDRMKVDTGLWPMLDGLYAHGLSGWPDEPR